MNPTNISTLRAKFYLKEEGPYTNEEILFAAASLLFSSGRFDNASQLWNELWNECSSELAIALNAIDPQDLFDYAKLYS